MTRASLAAVVFVSSAAGCNSIFGVDELVEVGSAAASTSDSSVTISASSSAEAASSSSAGGAGGGMHVGGKGGSPNPKRVFVTSQTFFPDDINYVANANNLCQAVAANSALPAGTWRAWISDLNIDAIDNIVGDGPWHRLDGALVFDSKADIVDNDALANPIIFDEDLYPTDAAVFTGTAQTGVVSFACTAGGQSWTSQANRGATYGIADQQDEDWTSYNVSPNCAVQARLYCFEE